MSTIASAQNYKPMEKSEIVSGEGVRRLASCNRCYEEAPQLIEADGARTWLTRSANVVVAVTEALAGTRLDRAEQADEYMVLIPAGVPATITAGGETLQTPGGVLVIVPPGPSSIVAGPGTIVRFLTNRASDLLAKVSNPEVYADGAPEVAPVVAWPDPPAGFKLRSYDLANLSGGTKVWGRVIRSTNMMINLFEPRPKPKDVTKLSPHSHTDFEQISVGIRGSFKHHLRAPWTIDSTKWKEDVHLSVGSPSITVIPAQMIHTSHNFGDVETWMVDVFAPPRVDFSLREGFVRNEGEYPMPEGIDASAGAGAGD